MTFYVGDDIPVYEMDCSFIFSRQCVMLGDFRINSPDGRYLVPVLVYHR